MQTKLFLVCSTKSYKPTRGTLRLVRPWTNMIVIEMEIDDLMRTAHGELHTDSCSLFPAILYSYLGLLSLSFTFITLHVIGSAD